MLRLDGVTYRHAGAVADSLREVSLELRPGSITGLVGASEAGKSTLCLVAAGLAPRVIRGTLRGRVTIDGVAIATLPTQRTAERVVLGVQDPTGQLSMVADSVYEEVAFGPANLAVPHGEVIERVEGALERVGIADLARRDPRRLSAGQQQLVVIAGLLAMASDYLILDEPLAHLDELSTGHILEALGNVAANGTAVLMAEHRTAALLHVAASVAVIDAGRIVRQGPTSEVLGDQAIIDLGIEEPAALRLERLMAAAAPGAQP